EYQLQGGAIATSGRIREEIDVTEPRVLANVSWENAIKQWKDVDMDAKDAQH
ncbi:hypothetical protein BGZ79_003199, partial [Entomortierella chlamydospora]